MPDLQDKIIIITGASSGIGAALCRTCSIHGAKVALAARREDLLQRVASECPGETLVIPSDVTTDQGRRDIARKTLEKWGRIDVLVNNAGLGAYGPFWEASPGEWRELFEINLFSLVFLTSEVLSPMLERDRGVIVNVASIGGLVAHSPNVSAYVASKHAVVGFSRGLQKDLAETGIVVKAVCPHMTATEFFEASPGAEAMRSEVEKYRSFMDSPEAVAEGIVAGLDGNGLIVFPTDKPARFFEKTRDV